jgi:hypothetical protein
MAVTQQIVRISEGDIIKCSQSEEKCDELISFKLNAALDELDLDWAHQGLDIYCNKSNQKDDVCTAISTVLDGIQLINELYKSGTNSYQVYSDITYTSPEKVKESASAFRLINWASLESCMPQNKGEALKLLKVDLVCHPNEYYIPKLRELVSFVQETANRNMGLAQWWD